jgi:hypothetical protein
MEIALDDYIDDLVAQKQQFEATKIEPYRSRTSRSNRGSPLLPVVA